MREDRLKIWVSALLIGSHVVVIATVVVLHLLRALLADEMAACLTLIGPTFAIYAAAALRFILHQAATRRSTRTVSRARVAVTFLYPSLFIIATLSVIMAKAFNLAFVSLEEFRVMLSVVQGAFGVYGGQVVASLFDQPGARGHAAAGQS